MHTETPSVPPPTLPPFLGELPPSDLHQAQASVPTAAPRRRPMAVARPWWDTAAALTIATLGATLILALAWTAQPPAGAGTPRAAATASASR
jgi:hypothetical protein